MENYERIFNSALYRRTFCCHLPDQHFCDVDLRSSWISAVLLVDEATGQNICHFDGFCVGPILDVGSGSDLRMVGAVATKGHHQFVVDVDGALSTNRCNWRTI